MRNKDRDRGGECNPRSFTAAVIHSLVARLLTAARRHSGLRLLMIYRARAETCVALLRAKVRCLPRGPAGPFSLLHLPPAADR